MMQLLSIIRNNYFILYKAVSRKRSKKRASAHKFLALDIVRCLGTRARRAFLENEDGKSTAKLRSSSDKLS